MVGGAGYMAGKAGQRASYREQEEQERISALESQQAQQQAAPPPPPPPAPPPPAPAAAPAGDDMVSKIRQLADLKSSGVLTDEEFNAAKAKLLGT
jgi:hypothetical protein